MKIVRLWKLEGIIIANLAEGWRYFYFYRFCSVNHLRCVIKMTKYTPISGGNITELNKIPELFLNKRSLLMSKNNNDECFYIVILKNF